MMYTNAGRKDFLRREAAKRNFPRFGQCDWFVRGSNKYMHKLPFVKDPDDAKDLAIDVVICHLSKFGDSGKFVVFGGFDLKPVLTFYRQEVMKVIDDASR